MKTKTVQVMEGECLGPVDWDYDFRSHDWNHGGAVNPERVVECVNRLKQLTDGQEWEATTDGGAPKCGWGRVLEVGMYDGWPYWRPVPSVYISSWLGGAWYSFTMVSAIRRA